jgi:hypothetical protein
MNEALETRIAALPTLNKAQLLPIWEEVFSSPPPPTLRKQIMVPILAYRMQEKEYGGLSHSARQRLKTIAQGLGRRRRGSLHKEEDPNPGTRLIRLWRGEVHEVVCREGIYEYRGREFASLSKIAKEITGAHRSGPAFFGTKGKQG